MIMNITIHDTTFFIPKGMSLVIVFMRMIVAANSDIAISEQQIYMKILIIVDLCSKHCHVCASNRI